MKKEEFKKVKTTSISAVIPIKYISTRCPQKNYRDFGGTNLITLCVEKLNQLSFIDEVVISVDDIKLCSFLKDLRGVRIEIREENLRSPLVSMNDIYSHMATICRNKHILYTSCTTPLIKLEHFIEGYEKWRSFDFKGSVHSVSNCSDFLLKDGRPLNFDKSNFPRSQDLPDIKKLVYGFSFIERSDFRKGSSVSNEISNFVNIPFPFDLDIDTELDFQVAELLYGKV